VARIERIELRCDMPHVEKKTTGTGRNRKTEEIPVQVDGKTTRTVVVDGDAREIDLCEDDDNRIMAILNEVLAHGRRVTLATPSSNGRRGTGRRAGGTHVGGGGHTGEHSAHSRVGA
jgi:hypothetical protein